MTKPRDRQSGRPLNLEEALEDIRALEAELVVWRKEGANAIQATLARAEAAEKELEAFRIHAGEKSYRVVPGSLYDKEVEDLKAKLAEAEKETTRRRQEAYELRSRWEETGAKLRRLRREARRAQEAKP